MKVVLSLFRNVISKIFETVIATITPRRYSPRMTKMLDAPKNAPPTTA